MTPIIILAAGASSRLGTPKQLVPYNGRFLLLHAIYEALATGSPVIVVLGANANCIRPSIEREPVHVVVNPDWEAGPGTSISAGIKALDAQAPDANGVLLMLCDQPFADRCLLTALLKAKETSGKEIVACAYGSTIGVPVLFSHRYFDALQTLPPRKGAKSLLNLHSTDLTIISFPKGIIDIDTAKDYERCLQHDASITQ